MVAFVEMLDREESLKAAESPTTGPLPASRLKKSLGTKGVTATATAINGSIR